MRRALEREGVRLRLEKSLLERFDGILVMKDGKIVERGNFHDLMDEFAKGEGREGLYVLGFGALEEERIDEAVAVLASVFQ